MVYTNGRKTFYTALNPALATGIIINKKMFTYVWWKLCTELGMARTNILGQIVAVPEVEDFVMWDPDTDIIVFETTCSDIRYVQAKAAMEKEYPGLFIWDYHIRRPHEDGR